MGIGDTLENSANITNQNLYANEKFSEEEVKAFLKDIQTGAPAPRLGTYSKIMWRVPSSVKSDKVKDTFTGMELMKIVSTQLLGIDPKNTDIRGGTTEKSGS